RGDPLAADEIAKRLGHRILVKVNSRRSSSASPVILRGAAGSSRPPVNQRPSPSPGAPGRYGPVCAGAVVPGAGASRAPTGAPSAPGRAAPGTAGPGALPDSHIHVRLVFA